MKNAKTVTIDLTKSVVAKHYRLDISELNENNFSWPRAVAMYLARELTEQSLAAIGNAFHKDNDSALLACKDIKHAVRYSARFDSGFSGMIDSLKAKIKASA